MQNYKVHAYLSSMEFSAVNCRRPSRETPLGPGVKKDGCFRRLPNCEMASIFQTLALTLWFTLQTVLSKWQMNSLSRSDLQFLWPH